MIVLATNFAADRASLVNADRAPARSRFGVNTKLRGLGLVAGVLCVTAVSTATAQWTATILSANNGFSGSHAGDVRDGVQVGGVVSGSLSYA